MKATLGLLFASAALSTAQVIKNGNGTYTCALESGTYCVSASLESSMIIRCNNGVGYTSNCDERLADKAPLDTSYSPCWQASPRSGNAQCSKNGIIYPDGNNTTPYPVPNYQKISASISSAATATTAPSKFAYVANFTTSTTTSRWPLTRTHRRRTTQPRTVTSRMQPLLLQRHQFPTFRTSQSLSYPPTHNILRTLSTATRLYVQLGLR
jgi:hypothetical protein